MLWRYNAPTDSPLIVYHKFQMVAHFTQQQRGQGVITEDGYLFLISLNL